jgi:hypothetical protein
MGQGFRACQCGIALEAGESLADCARTSPGAAAVPNAKESTMSLPTRCIRTGLTALCLSTLLVLDCAADAVGQVKVSKGQVAVERGGRTLPAQVGMPLELADTLKTGADGSVGVTMRDNSLLSAGPNSVLSLEQFEFDPATSEGRFESRLQRGTLAVVSGRIAKNSPSAMTVRTPSAVLGVRGTEFLVLVNE